MNSQDSDQPSSHPSTNDAPADEQAAPKPRRKHSPAAADAVPAQAQHGVVAVVPALAAQAVAGTAADGVIDAEAQVKPKRGRRKLADAEPAADAETAAPESESSDTAVPAKAVRGRRRAVADAGALLPVEAAAAHQPAADSAEPVAHSAKPVAAGKRPRRLAVAAATVLAEAGALAAPNAATAPVPLAAAMVVVAATLPSGNDAADAGQAAEATEGDGPRRRNRNRRRGRRGGAERAARDEAGGQGADADADAEQVLTVSASLGDDDDDGDDNERADQPANDGAVRAAPLDAGETFAAVLSGDYDAEAGETVAEPERRVLAAEPDAPKLHKVLAQAGIGSRRDMEDLIAEGQVMVNGQVAHTGQRISFGDRISVAGKLIKVRIAPPPPRIIAYHKPVGEVVTHDDPQQRPTVFRRLPRLPHGKWQSVGRLDINTEGLLLFTNSGELANQLMHPRFGVEREYAVRVLGTLEADGKQRLLEGVDIDGQRAMFMSIEDGGGEGVNHWYRVVITEGRNREVRKLFDKVGLGVSRLIRIRYGCVVLPRGLRRGVFVDLNEGEVREVRRLAGNARDQHPVAGGGAQRSERPARNESGQPGRGQQDRGQQERGPREAAGGQQRQNKQRNGPPQQSAERDRPERGGPRQQERRERPPVDHDGEGEPENFGNIPNPLMQTFDKRAIKEARTPRREYAEDGPIPNPLEQTYDKRFVQKPKGFGGGDGGGGRKGGGGGAGGGQPDPMKTTMGYIGADAFVRKFQGNSGRGGGVGEGGGGGGGGGRKGGGGGGGGGRKGGGGGRRGGGGR